MGNSTNFPQLRTIAIHSRSQSLTKTHQELLDILQQHNITKTQIETITRMSLEQLVSSLNDHSLTSELLTAIYCIRASSVGIKLCLITEDNFVEAIHGARLCDQHRRITKLRNWTFGDQWNMEKYLPPLYGIPISIKDNIDMKGKSSTIGITVRANRPAQSDNSLIICLKSSGMLPFVRSNLPQLAMTFDSNNFLWGRALNPWNETKSVGGSSGGQGGLLAARCSPIGVGNDIGGSLRIPAQFCGICTLKPCQNRLPNSFITTYAPALTGMNSILAVTGPMSTSVSALALWMKIVCTESFYNGLHDRFQKLIPFDDKTYMSVGKSLGSKGRIGYLKTLGFVQSSPANQRAVDQTIKIVKEIGYEPVLIDIPNERDIILAFFSEMSAEGGFKSYYEMLEGEQMIPEYHNVALAAKLNFCTHWLATKVLSCLQPRIGEITNATFEKTTHEYLLNGNAIKKYRKQWVDYWLRMKLDYVIMPGFGTYAMSHGAADDGVLAAAYTFLWNVLNMTVGSMPVTVVSTEEQHYDSIWDDKVSEKLRDVIKDTQGLPVGIQVVGLPYQDEKVLGLMRVLQEKINFKERHPYPDTQKFQ